MIHVFVSQKKVRQSRTRAGLYAQIVSRLLVCILFYNHFADISEAPKIRNQTKVGRFTCLLYNKDNLRNPSPLPRPVCHLSDCRSILSFVLADVTKLLLVELAIGFNHRPITETAIGYDCQNVPLL